MSCKFCLGKKKKKKAEIISKIPLSLNEKGWMVWGSLKETESDRTNYVQMGFSQTMSTDEL